MQLTRILGLEWVVAVGLPVWDAAASSVAENHQHCIPPNHQHNHVHRYIVCVSMCIVCLLFNKLPYFIPHHEEECFSHQPALGSVYNLVKLYVTLQLHCIPVLNSQ